MSTQSTVHKVCCKCGKNVAGAPREKDREGRYWCIPCSNEDKLHQLHVRSGICEGCGESPGQAALMLLGGKYLCQACRTRKYKYGLDKSKDDSGGGILGSIKSLFGK
jgi:formylmethanofuran dehydrogenase subunit E